jgi:UDP-N-acetylmuramoyl-tripeptide--D-alanyl-D-alanine ligase
LEDLAAHARTKFAGDVIGITGSAGKTTSKEVIAALLGAALRVGKTSGNYNNHVGLPLSLLRLPGDAQVAVLEMGMNHAGEIRHLAGIARPRIGVVTNVGYAHIENFDSIDGIAAAKRELVDSLPDGGVAVLNADDPRVARFAEAHSGRTVTFGIESPAEVRAEEVSYLADGVKFRAAGVAFESQLAGRHQVLNILAGIAVAGLFGIAPERLRDAVRSLAPSPMRGERMVRHGVTIWNDCYNANPDAMRGMLDVLRDSPAERRIAVLGEMLELGHWAEPLHRDVGVYAAKSGVSVLVGIRGAARFLVEAATQSGLDAGAAYFFDTPGEAGEFLRGVARPGDAILFKGSRGTRVEQALERYLA